MPPGLLMIHAGIVAFVGAVVLAVLFAARGGARIFAATVSGLVFLLLLYLFIIAPGQAYVAVENTLKVNAPPYARMDVPWEEISEAYVADWSARSEIAPVQKTNALVQHAPLSDHATVINFRKLGTPFLRDRPLRGRNTRP